MRALKIAAFGLVSVIGGLNFGFISSARAAWVPPAGYERVGGTITGQSFAVAPDGKVAVGINKVGVTAGSVKVYANAADAAAGTSPIQTFTDPTFNSFGDITFDGNNTVLFSEFSNGTVYSGQVGTGASTALAPANSVPFPQGVVAHNGAVYATSVIGPGASDVIALAGGAATTVISNIGNGYIGGLAFDAAGNLLVTDSNDPSFTGASGRLLRFDGLFSPLSPIVLDDGPGGAGVRGYDLAIDSEGDIFVSTGPTLTHVSSDYSLIEQFGPTFVGGFEFVAGLDFAG
ncbi:MAG: hypothetical protein QOE14_2060, partial [Humisphaera sp.]|nr:hypothetical protein [Humisphaera sp.]